MLVLTIEHVILAFNAHIFMFKLQTVACKKWRKNIGIWIHITYSKGRRETSFHPSVSSFIHPIIHPSRLFVRRLNVVCFCWFFIPYVFNNLAKALTYIDIYRDTHTYTHTHTHIYIKPAYQVKHFVLKYLLAVCLPKSRILVFRFINRV